MRESFRGHYKRAQVNRANSAPCTPERLQRDLGAAEVAHQFKQRQLRRRIRLKRAKDLYHPRWVWNGKQALSLESLSSSPSGPSNAVDRKSTVVEVRSPNQEP